jgi:hypothetical protein
MELQTRLNVLAAIISFAFLTAVVFGRRGMTPSLARCWYASQ